MKRLAIIISVIGFVLIGCVNSGPPPARKHVITQLQGDGQTQPAETKPITHNHTAVSIDNGVRVIQANGIPNHLTGSFPNSGNPNAISAQDYTFKVPASPQVADEITPLSIRYSFGIGVNGVPFDPSADEWYLGMRGGQWQYEPLSGVVPLGVDDNHAHVQPSGAYHYHGLPTGLFSELSLSPSEHSSLVGWAADGFPIYALYGYQNTKDAHSPIVQMTPSYRVRAGKRPKGDNDPAGRYDGTFLADYEFIEGAGTLDECNGRQTVTPDFPDGIYAYFLTSAWPVIPRCHRGTLSDDFLKLPPAGR